MGLDLYRKEIICKGLRSHFSCASSNRYSVPEMPKIYSLVAFGKCNFACRFCFSCGSDSDGNGIFPDAKSFSIEILEDFVKCEVQQNMAIRFSGGEPTLFPDTVIRLATIVRNLKGVSILDTNGSLPEVVERLAPHVDIISVDALKDEFPRVEFMTGRKPSVSWEPALMTIRSLSALPCTVEYKTVIYEHTTFEFLDFIANQLPNNLIWTLKQYQPTKCHFPESPELPIIRLHQDNMLHMPSKEKLTTLASDLTYKFKKLKGRLQVVIGSAREASNYIHF